MPINFASQAGQMADIVSQPMNAFMQARSDRDATQARNVMLQQRQQAQQQAQIDAETQRDMQATYARLSAGDPQAAQYAVAQMPAEMRGQMATLAPEQQVAVTKRYLELALGITPAEEQQAAQITAQPGPFGSQIVSDGKRWQIVEPQRAPQTAAVDAPADQRLYQWYATLTPEEQQRFLQMKRANATPEIAAATTQATTTAKATADRAAAVEKKAADAQSVNEVLDLATPLVHVATGSMAAADKAANLFGYTFDGDSAISSLKILEAKIVLSMPRMEGPQSDRDAMLYREAAGQLGNPTITREKKLAAIRTIRALNAKYTKPAAAPAPAAGGRLKFDRNGNPVN